MKIGCKIRRLKTIRERKYIDIPPETLNTINSKKKKPQTWAKNTDSIYLPNTLNFRNTSV